MWFIKHASGMLSIRTFESGPPLPGGRLSQSQPEWMDPSPQVLGIRHVTALQLGRITRRVSIRHSSL